MTEVKFSWMLPSLADSAATGMQRRTCRSCKTEDGAVSADMVAAALGVPPAA